jgi:ribonuclease D
MMAPDRFDLPTAFVDSPEALAEALPHWFAANLLAVDIECSLTGFHHCVLALLQVATHDRAWLLDPLAIPGLMQPALQAMAAVPWIAHDFSGDGIVFQRIYGVLPVSVMDTMLLARTLGYPQPGLKTMARLKLGIEIPKEEQDSNWMIRPLRESQLRYAARDASLLLPLLRSLADEAEHRRADPAVQESLARLPEEMKRMLHRVRHYQAPQNNPVLDKVRNLGLGEAALEKARRLTELRRRWGNQGDVAAVMELGNRWIVARLEHPPKTREALERCMPNPRFRKARLDALWEILGES